MDYRLRYDAGNGYTDLDLGDEKPAMNYQINNLNELKDRQAAFSQAIKLPKTPHNLRAFGFIDSFDTVANAAYNPGRCQLLCEGALLTPFGSVLYVDSVDERQEGYINCQIVSGTKDLFSSMADVSNEDMGDDIWKAMWTSNQLVADNSDSSGKRRWPLVFTQEGQYTYTPPLSASNEEEVQIYHLVPCYHYNTLIKELLAKYGYDLESNLLTDEYVNSLYISASKIGDAAEAKAVFVGSKHQVPTASPSGSGYEEVSAQSIDQDDVFAGNYSYIVSLGNHVDMRYYAMQDSSYRVSVVIQNVGTEAITGSYLRYSIFKGKIGSEAQETIVSDVYVGFISPGSSYERADFDPIDLEIGEYVAVRLERYYVQQSTPVVNPGFFSFAISVYQNPDNANPGPGAHFDYIQSTGFKNYKEVVQSYMQLFGAMVDVKQSQSAESGHQGTVRIYTFDELFRRRADGKIMDWSEKLVLDSERTDGFSISNYAQKNIISLSANSDDGTQDEGSFPVNNKTLEGEKSLFTIPVEAGRNIAYSAGGIGRTVAVIPTLERDVETDDDGNEKITLSYKGCKTHLVRMTGDSTVVKNISGFRASGQYVGPQYMSLPVAVSVPMQNLVDKYYARIKDMLHNARTLSAYFNLSALDIDQVDLFTPVWVKHYGAYFYISKINNFVAGQPTRVDLIRITGEWSKTNYYLYLNDEDTDQNNVNVPADGTTISYRVESNGTPYIVSKDSRLTADIAYGPGGVLILNIIVPKNTLDAGVDYEPVILGVRESESVRRKVDISQLPTGYYLTLNGSAGDIELDAESTAQKLYVAYQTNGTLESNSSGEVIDATLVDGVRINIYTQANPSSEPRTGTVAVTLREAPSIRRNIIIKQAGAMAYDPSVSFSETLPWSTYDAPITMTNNGNVDLEVISIPDWFLYTGVPHDLPQGEIFAFGISQNTTGELRSGTVGMRYQNVTGQYVDYNVEVSQKGTNTRMVIIDASIDPSLAGQDVIASFEVVGDGATGEGSVQIADNNTISLTFEQVSSYLGIEGIEYCGGDTLRVMLPDYGYLGDGIIPEETGDVHIVLKK